MFCKQRSWTSHSCTLIKECLSSCGFSLDHCIPIGGVCINICMLTPSSGMGQSNQQRNRVCSKTDCLNKGIDSLPQIQFL